MLTTHMHVSHSVVVLNQINKMGQEIEIYFPYYSIYCVISLFPVSS